MALGNLAQRFLVAVVAVPILLVLLHLQRPEPVWALIFAASLIAMHEFFTMTLPVMAFMALKSLDFPATTLVRC